MPVLLASGDFGAVEVRGSVFKVAHGEIVAWKD
jgi:hypothetical protein